MTTKPAPPPAAAEWLRNMQAHPPRCCHTCYKYQDDGTCEQFGMRPPDEFTQTMNACDQWEDMIPF